MYHYIRKDSAGFVVTSLFSFYFIFCSGTSSFHSSPSLTVDCFWSIMLYISIFYKNHFVPSLHYQLDMFFFLYLLLKDLLFGFGKMTVFLRIKERLHWVQEQLNRDQICFNQTLTGWGLDWATEQCPLRDWRLVKLKKHREITSSHRMLFGEEF